MHALPAKISLRSLNSCSLRIGPTVSCCNNVHWQDLAALARASPHLQEVHLTECRYTDKEAILDLLISCSQLDYISVMCCPKLS
eukprot:SM000089S23849  [mRNA]  locus=s89:307969:308693:+ [translate_table: standard]